MACDAIHTACLCLPFPVAFLLGGVALFPRTVTGLRGPFISSWYRCHGNGEIRSKRTGSVVGTTPGGRKQVIPLRIYRMRKQWTLVSGGGGRTRSESSACHLVAVWRRASYLTSLCLSSCHCEAESSNNSKRSWEVRHTTPLSPCLSGLGHPPKVDSWWLVSGPPEDPGDPRRTAALCRIPSALKEEGGMGGEGSEPRP